MNADVTDIDAYLAPLPEPTRATLEAVRRAILAAAPEAVESISYGMPTFKYRGRPVAYFGAWKDHCALYGTSEGTIRFPLDTPLADARIAALVGARKAEIDAAALNRRRKPPGTEAGR
jgi:uncharacterized protein YdhG (YjbR/CyaY superfamily)